MESKNLNDTKPISTIPFCSNVQTIKSPNLGTTNSLQVSKGALITAGIVCPASVILNTLVLLSFYKKQSLRTQSNTGIAVMALNDVIRGGIAGPFFMSKEINYQMGKEVNCPSLIGQALTLSIVSDMFVAGMNIEKFLALRFPYWHRVHVTTKRILISSLITAILGLSATVLRIFSESGRVPIVALFTLSALSTVISAILIWRVIFKRNHQIHVHSQQANTTTASGSQRKAAKMATYIAVGIILTNVLPLVTLTSIFNESKSAVVAEPLNHALTLLGCLINPIIYCLMNQEIRKACKELIKCVG